MSTPHAGGCHCRAVRFEVELDLKSPVSRCNCTLCTKRSSSNALVKPSAFRLLAGADCLGDYEWGGKTMHFHFCKCCGIHVFARGNIPELGGEFVTVNVLCIDDLDPKVLTFVYWDGRHNNWDAGPREKPWPVTP